MSIKSKVNNSLTYMINDLKFMNLFIILTSFFVASICEIKSWDIDYLFMYRQGADMLENGLVRMNDAFSVHDMLFTNQRILMCLFTYFVYELGGHFGIRIVAICMTASLLSLLWHYMTKYNSKTVSLNFFVYILCCFGLFQYTSFRANVITVIILLDVMHRTENFIHGKYEHKIFYFVYCFLIGCFVMWVQSSSWYMLLIVLLPYLCDFKFLHKFIFSNQDVEYPKLPILAGFVCMFAGSLLNPYGIYVYDYVFKCMTSTNAFYANLVIEMKRSIFTVPNFVVIVLSAIILCFSFQNKIHILRAYYLIAGSCVMIFLADRMAYFSIILICFAYCIIIKNTIEIKVSMIPLGFIVGLHMLFAFFWSLCLLMNFGTFDGIKDIKTLTGVNIVMDNNQNYKGLKIFSEFDAGDYIIFNDMKSYVDGRFEFFDDHFNETKNIAREYARLALGKFSDEEYDEFVETYDFDYYIVPRNRENNQFDAFSEYLAKDAYMNYQNDYYTIYSYRDNRKLEQISTCIV